MKGKSAVVTALGDFWSERSPREKQVMLIGSAVLALVISYSILLEPALTGRARLRDELPVMQRRLAQMSADAVQARSLSKAAHSRAPSGIALKEALVVSLAQHGLAATQLNVVGPNIQFKLKDVEFGTWIAWLNSVRQQFKVKVAEAHVSALKDIGHVDVAATLQPANAK